MQKNWRDMIKPKYIEIDERTHSPFYGEFDCQPLEKGYGITLGNSLRRVLLSSVYGAAIVSVKIDGVFHEFSTIPGVKEDVTDIILNIKGICLKLHGDGPRTIYIDAAKEGALTAGDILTGGAVEVLNPDHHIATLSEGATFKAEMVVKIGKGYVPAKTGKDPDQPEGVINIDEIYSPIKKVAYSVTNARVGQITDYDRLVLEVWTDGSILPEDAVDYAARTLTAQLEVFIRDDGVEEVEEKTAEEKKPKEQVNDNLFKSVDELELSVRSANCLKNAGIRYIGELVQRSEAEMLKTKNFGRKSLNEIREILSEMELNLGMKIDFSVSPQEEDTEG
ncbi:MAG: DNA-directed RNA polymerase subunit alpha [Deltaproteobacteria bacterium]|nr:DNA-directed RNA polymerase subunit alpha [Deltaproteobacteria bacterium]